MIAAPASLHAHDGLLSPTRAVLQAALHEHEVRLELLGDLALRVALDVAEAAAAVELVRGGHQLEAVEAHGPVAGLPRRSEEGLEDGPAIRLYEN